MRPPEEVKRKLVRQWFGKAAEDLAVAEELVERGMFQFAACFHAQQCAEKYLKALLTWMQIEFPKTHDIRELLALVAGQDPAVTSELEEASKLTPYGVQIRYPGDAPRPSQADAEEAISLARSVEQAILSRLPADLDKPD